MSEPRQIKKTEIGELPIEWKVETLKNFCDHITKGATPTTYGFDWTDSGIRFLRSECVKESGLTFEGANFISNNAHQAMNRSVIKGGDLLVSITGNIGRACVYPQGYPEGNINQHIARVRVVKNDVLNPLFLLYYINSEKVRNHFYFVKTGLAYPQISLKQVQELQVPIPPKVEQDKIAAILTSVDDAINATQRIIDQTEVVKRGLMQQLLTKGIGHTKFKQTEIGEIPTEWDVVPLSNVMNLVARPMKMDEEEEYQLVTVKRRHGGVVPRERLLGKNILVKNQFYIREGDFLISKRQIVHGACEVVPKDLDGAIVSNEYHTLSVSSNFDMNYFRWFCRTPMMMKYFLVSSIGVHIEKMLFKLDDWFKRKVPLPPLEEQKEIAKVLTSVERSIKSNHDYLGKLTLLKSGLMQLLLTGKARVNVDEPSEVSV
ncbi:restriction endonuclease subunit S [Alicyclobacillus ferrooxydans]|uniref:restriction endonuclease subunit S n=1 Tax=Alicyclobacillus ferrooxydans TaxID=471514 RepID=UPI0014701AAA|nr:restriction endonuclease subunit S [Alicyclobacillus ferrooxydans]